jgi:hypothetical protein
MHAQGEYIREQLRGSENGNYGPFPLLPAYATPHLGPSLRMLGNLACLIDSLSHRP